MSPPRAQDAAPKWSAILEVRDPDGTRTRHPFRHPRMTVGRARDNDLSLADEGVSHRHCEFVAEQGYLLVRDLGSQNGTWVNERRTPQMRLRDGDEVRIGATRLGISLQGEVRRPERRRRGRALGIFLGLAAAGAVWLGLARRQDSMRAAYAAALREQVAGDVCKAPQFDALDAAAAELKGRSFALTRGVKLSKEDEALDRELNAIYRRRLALCEEAYRALVTAQEERRQAVEKLSRKGARLWTAGGRRTAAYVDGLLQERTQAVDDLMAAVKQVGDDTAQLTASVDALFIPAPDAQTAEHLQTFRFRTDLRAARAACDQKAARVEAGLFGALTALGE
jgi:FHA domain